MQFYSYNKNSFIGFYNLIFEVDGDSYNISQRLIRDHNTKTECPLVQIYKHCSIYSVYAPADARGKQV